MTEYEPTHHAAIRASQRVGIKGKGNELRANAKNWLNQIIPKSLYAGKDEDGYQIYRYKEFKIVVAPNNKVVTISYYNGKDNGLSKEITEMIKRKIKKEVKPFKSKLRKVSIEMHEAEIKRLKSFNPKSVDTITKEINTLRDEVAKCEADISDIEGLAGRYGITL